VGVLLFCRTQRFLGVRIHLDQARLLALSPDLDLATVQQELDDIVQICEGGPQAEPLGQMSQSERFHWLVSPSSTVIQTSPVHTGLSSNPEAALEQLFKTMVYR